jgi:hypothetical protein
MVEFFFVGLINLKCIRILPKNDFKNGKDEDDDVYKVIYFSFRYCGSIDCLILRYVVAFGFLGGGVSSEREGIVQRRRGKPGMPLRLFLSRETQKRLNSSFSMESTKKSKSKNLEREERFF